MQTIAFTKVALPYGWLSSMSPYRIIYDNKMWRTTEALFQALRFSDDAIRELIRAQTSPMAAKLAAKARRTAMVVVPLSQQDLDNMRLVLRLKVEQHPELKEALLDTGDVVIIEDCSKRRASPWGAQRRDGSWVGDNWLGKLWMELRDELR